jgi:hypothetical protein
MAPPVKTLNILKMIECCNFRRPTTSAEAPTRRGSVAPDASERISAKGDVMEALMVIAAHANTLDRRVEEAERTTRSLNGVGNDISPLR